MAVGGGAREPEPVEEVQITPGVDEPLGTTVPVPMRVEVIAKHPHATDAFTQGLLWHDGLLYESTGLTGMSTLRQVDLTSGEVRRRVALDERLFAEGLALVGDRLFQITWHDEELLIWDRETLEEQERKRYDGEGWGLCYDGTHLVMSDGSARLMFRDPTSFDVVREVEVTKVGRPLRRLNELECVDGAVYANVWQTDDIVKIDPRSGRVTAIIDASGLLSHRERLRTDVLNGIAWLPDRGHFAITGKNWPHLFEVAFVPRDE